MLPVQYSEDTAEVFHAPATQDREPGHDHARFRLLDGDSSAPAAPTNLRAALAGNSVQLSWSAPNQDASEGSLSGLAGYQIYRRAAGASPRLLNQYQEVVATSYRDDELSDGVRYQYQVHAVDQAGNLGPASTEVALVSDLPRPRRPGRRLTDGRNR